MARIKDFKLFTEGYSDDLKEVLTNEENNFIVIKGGDILVGFEYIEDAFDYLGEILEGDGSISEEQKYEFDDFVAETLPSLDEPDQYEIDEFLADLLDKFNIIEPYSIKSRMELEETPLDPSLDDDFEDGEDSEEEYAEMLGENAIHEPFCIVGKFHGKEQEIDSFMSEEEANEYLIDYKTIYNEFEDMRVSSRIEESKINESNELIFVPTKTKECECVKKKNESTDTDTCDFDCKCQDQGFCSCGEDCDCEECADMKKDDKVHMAHCNKGEYEGSCKYGSDNCPALKKNESFDDYNDDFEDMENDMLRNTLEDSIDDNDDFLNDVDDDTRRDDDTDWWNEKDVEEEIRKGDFKNFESITRFKNFKK